jgi:hypothetical protein
MRKGVPPGYAYGCAADCAWENCNPVSGAPVDPQCGAPQCRICAHWRPKEPSKRKSGKNNWSAAERRCAMWEDFFTLPHYSCRAFAPRGKKR